MGGGASNAAPGFGGGWGRNGGNSGPNSFPAGAYYDYGAGGSGGNGGYGMGAGALFVRTGSVVLVNCTLTANSATGGAGGPLHGFPQQLGHTVNGDNGDASGGGIYNYQGAITLLNSCVAANSAYTGSKSDWFFCQFGIRSDRQQPRGNNLSINDFQNVPANLNPLRTGRAVPRSRAYRSRVVWPSVTEPARVRRGLTNGACRARKARRLTLGRWRSSRLLQSLPGPRCLQARAST